MAKIRINPEHTVFEFITPDGESYCAGSEAMDDCTVLGSSYLAVAGEFEGLKSNTMYKLVEISTEVETDADIEDDDDEDDEDEEEEAVKRSAPKGR